MAELSFYAKYLDICQRLKVPKLRQNDFGGYSYRNVEDIEDKLKPLLKEHQLGFKFSDDIVALEGRAWVKSRAVLFDSEGNEQDAYGFAREAEKPKAKTDDAQLTGGCSSYARKYAAQGLFLIDDGKGDPDNPKQESAQAVANDDLSAAKAKLFRAFKKAQVEETIDMMANIQQAIGKDAVETVEEAEKVIKHLETEQDS